MCGSGVLWHYKADNATSALAQRHHLAEVVRQHSGWGVDEVAAKVVFTELVGNVVLHAPGPVEVTLECDGESVLLNVSGQGPAFRFDPKLPDSLAERGRGLYIVSRFATEVRIETNKGLGVDVAAKLPARLDVNARN